MIRKLIRYSTSQQKLFVFAGQGTQEKGMFNKLNQTDRYKEIADKASRIIDRNILEITSEGCSSSQINQTQFTQPILLLSHYLQFLEKGFVLGRQDAMVGHSLGEYSALVCANSISLEDGIRLVSSRGALMKKYTKQPHGMLIIRYGQEKEQKTLNLVAQLELEISCYNTPANIIASGTKKKIVQLQKRLKEEQITCLMLPVSTAFHCQNLTPMLPEFEKLLNSISIAEPKCKVFRNYDARQYTDAQSIRQGLTKQINNPVMFHKCVLQVDKNIEYLEIGHKRHVGKYVDEIRNKM